MKQLNSRTDKVKYLQELQQGRISLQQFEKMATGQRVVLRTFEDHLRFFSCTDEKGIQIDREAQVKAGIIEIEMPDSPFNNFIKNLSKHDIQT